MIRKKDSNHTKTMTAEEKVVRQIDSAINLMKSFLPAGEVGMCQFPITMIMNAAYAAGLKKIDITKAINKYSKVMKAKVATLI